MSEIIDLGERERSLKSLGVVSYLLHTIVAVAAVLPGVQAGVALLLVAIILDLVKKDDAAGTWQASHFSWRIRSVLWAGGLYLLTLPLWLLFLVPGMIAWTLISIWLLYRIIRGWMNLSANRPI
ncbi:DUF4870 family protein [Caldimonas brevitalea]|uniref:Membrane protein n=1 Tax=Caldimonas brevitalea TaxID=413882 RepID=A0A0G3BPI4_9BURK|nr:membrane protein [Caldimonas brevitalea]AKJ31339.1 membrane protein [Caldimonas brevitalea]